VDSDRDATMGVGANMWINAIALFTVTNFPLLTLQAFGPPTLLIHLNYLLIMVNFQKEEVGKLGI
jgi:hypothetical protein